MSMHRFLTKTRTGVTVDVETGWDSAARGYFLTVRRADSAANEDWDEAELFSTARLAKSMPLPSKYEPLLSILEGMGITAPPAVLGDCLVDHMLCVNW